MRGCRKPTTLPRHPRTKGVWRGAKGLDCVVTAVTCSNFAAIYSKEDCKRVTKIIFFFASKSILPKKHLTFRALKEAAPDEYTGFSSRQLPGQGLSRSLYLADGKPVSSTLGSDRGFTFPVMPVKVGANIYLD
jgi:hypothetical protein